MATEDLDPRYIDIDKWSAIDAISYMGEGQLAAISAVLAAKDQIADAVIASKSRLFGTNGRLVYVGAGTSGRVAVQDGVELHPTYGWPWERLVFAMAGGDKALIQAVENAEDDYDAGFAAMKDANLSADDVVIGVAASGRTPFVLGAIHAAKELGALNLGFANNADTALLKDADIGVLLDTGSEPIAGSTRMKAGTAQKVALNLFSTTLMIALGGVYRGRMVGMRATNAKLRNRAVRMVISLTSCDEPSAVAAVAKAKGDFKLAILIALGVEDLSEGKKMLVDANGNLRTALESLME